MKTNNPSILRGILLALPLAAGLLFGTGLHAQIYVTNLNDHTLGEYNLNGSPVGSGELGPTGGGEDFGIALAGTNIIVANETGGINNAGSITEFTTNGTPVGTGTLVSSPLNPPSYLAVSGSDIFATSFSAGTVMEYTTAGAPVGSGTLISGLSGAYNSPFGIAVSGSDIFISDAVSILEYTTSGAPVGTGTLATPGVGDLRAIAVSGSDIFVTSAYGYVLEYTTSGSLVNASLVSGLANPEGIAVFGSNIYVTNVEGYTVQEYTMSGAPVGNGIVVSDDTGGPAGILIIPEPSTWAMLAMGGVVLFAGVRRIKSAEPSTSNKSP